MNDGINKFDELIAVSRMPEKKGIIQIGIRCSLTILSMRSKDTCSPIWPGSSRSTKLMALDSTQSHPFSTNITELATVSQATTMSTSVSKLISRVSFTSCLQTPLSANSIQMLLPLQRMSVECQHCADHSKMVESVSIIDSL